MAVLLSEERNRMKNKPVTPTKIDFNADDFEFRLNLIIEGYVKSNAPSLSAMIQILKNAIIDLELRQKVEKRNKRGGYNG